MKICTIIFISLFLLGCSDVDQTIYDNQANWSEPCEEDIKNYLIGDYVVITHGLYKGRTGQIIDYLPTHSGETPVYLMIKIKTGILSYDLVKVNPIHLERIN